MTSINKSARTGLTKEKKKILESLKGSASSVLDLNKVRDEWKNAKD